MRVLLLQRTPLRGAAQRVAAMLQKHTALEVRLAAFSDWRGNMADVFHKDRIVTQCWWQPELPIYSAANAAVLESCLSWADVWHFVHMTSPTTFDRPEFFAARKPSVVQVFGVWTGAFRDAWPPAQLARLRRVALIAEGFQRFVPNGVRYMFLPMLYDVDHELLTPRPFAERAACVSWGFPVRPYTHGDRRKDKYDYGSGRLQTLLAGLPCDWFARLSYDHALRRRAAGWVGIDELESPMIHNTTWEYACLGVPCLKRFDSATLDALQAVTGRRDPPFVNVTYDTVREEAERALATPPDEWRARCEATRAWVVEHYHPREMAKQYVALYEEAAR